MFEITKAPLFDTCHNCNVQIEYKVKCKFSLPPEGINVPISCHPSQTNFPDNWYWSGAFLNNTLVNLYLYKTSIP